MAAIINQVYFQYFVYILAVGNIFFLVHSKNFMSVGVFIVSAAMISFFYSKNIAVILLVAIILSHFVCINMELDGFKTKKIKDNSEEIVPTKKKTVKTSIAALLKDVKIIKKELTS